jgi:hypothetical protein
MKDNFKLSPEDAETFLQIERAFHASFHPNRTDRRWPFRFIEGIRRRKRAIAAGAIAAIAVGSLGVFMPKSGATTPQRSYTPAVYVPLDTMREARQQSLKSTTILHLTATCDVELNVMADNLDRLQRLGSRTTAGYPAADAYRAAAGAARNAAVPCMHSDGPAEAIVLANGTPVTVRGDSLLAPYVDVAALCDDARRNHLRAIQTGLAEDAYRARDTAHFEALLSRAETDCQ